MNFHKIKISLILILILGLEVSNGEPVTMTVAAVGAVGVISAYLAGGYCFFQECCSERWISTNFTALHQELNKKIYGQHLVIEPLVKHLKAHAKDNPTKALALSFHGWTGTGKNYVSAIVAQQMFRKGMKSKYVHLISATKEFPHEQMVPLYKDKLREMIEKAVKDCPRSLFIFDEMDKMPAGLIDTIKPYLDYYDQLRGVDYRKATFFFLSNTAGNDIAEESIKHWSNGHGREKLTLKEMEKVIQLPALNAKSGLWHSELITKHLITAYIPFLPLERRHIKQCIRDGLISNGYYKSKDRISEKKVQEIADELQYYPEGVGIFSTTGCKRVNEKIGLIMEDL